MRDHSGSGDGLSSIRARTLAVGLDLDDDRLRGLVESLESVNKMVEVIEQVEIDPLDLAVESFDPAWPREGRRR